MREIKFRGKSKLTGKWVYGNYDFYIFIKTNLLENIIENKNELPIPIDIKTLGEYTGLKDQNGKEIYEGDVVAMQFQRACKRKKAVIKYIDKYAGFVLTETLKEKENTSLGDYQMENVEVIGNIYDNPELLEEGE